MKTIYYQEKYKHVNVKRNQQIYASKKLKKKINAIVSHASKLIAISIYEQVLKLHQDEFY